MPTRRAPSKVPPPIDHAAIGSRLRETRKARGLTLAQLSARSGVALSTISKAERGEIALTYDKFAALGRALGLDLGALFGHAAEAGAALQPCFTPKGGELVYDTPNYRYGMLASGLQGKRMVPMLARIHARSTRDFPSYIRHEGQEFVYVLGGSLKLAFEDGRSFALKAGDSLYFDSSVGHLYLSTGRGDAQAVVCCVDTAGVDSPRDL